MKKANKFRQLKPKCLDFFTKYFAPEKMSHLNSLRAEIIGRVYSFRKSPGSLRVKSSRKGNNFKSSNTYPPPLSQYPYLIWSVLLAMRFCLLNKDLRDRYDPHLKYYQYWHYALLLDSTWKNCLRKKYLWLFSLI